MATLNSLQIYFRGELEIALGGNLDVNLGEDQTSNL